MLRNIILLSVLTRPRCWRMSAIAVGGAVLAFSVELPAAAAETVTQQFQKAQKLYKEGQTKAAAGILRGIVKKYPDHQPSHILLGRIAFGAGKVKRAIRHFKKVPLDLVSSDIAYEYGVSMFVGKEFGLAAKALGKVPFGAREYDLASFYRGLSYMRLSQYQRALNTLNRAEKLPANLESSKREAVEILQQKLRSEQRGGVTQQAPYVIAPTPPPPFHDAYGAQPPPPEGEKDAEASKKPAKPPPPPKTGLSTAIVPSVTIAQTTTQSDMHGFETKDSELRDTTIALSTSLRYDAQPRPSGGQPFASLKLDFKQFNETSKGSSIKYVAYESDPTTVREEATIKDGASTKDASVAARPELGYPLTGAIDLKLAYNYKGTYPDFKADKAVTASGPEGRVGVGIAGINLAGTGTQTTTADAKGKPISIDTEVKGEASKSFDTMTLSVNGSQKQTDSPNPEAPNVVKERQLIEGAVAKTWDSFSITATGTNTTWGFIPGKLQTAFPPVPTTALRMQLSTTKTFEFGGSLTGTVAQTKQEGIYWGFDDKTQQPEGDKYPQKPVQADNTVQEAIVSLKLTPFDWLSISTGFNYTQNAYVIADPTMEIPWQQLFPEVVTSFNVSITVSKTF